MDKIWNEKLAAGLEQLKQLYNITHIYYGLREYDGVGYFCEPSYLDFHTEWQVIFVDECELSVAITIGDDIFGVAERIRTNVLLITLACLKVFQENELDFPFWNVVYSKTDWDLVRSMIETTMHVVTMSNACRLDAFDPPEEENVEWLDLTYGVSEDWFGYGNDLEQLAYCVTHG